MAASYEIFAVDTVANAKSILKNNRYDFYLIDVELPDGKGYEVCQYIRLEKKDTTTPIIFLTGRQDTEAELQCFAVGAQDFIKKPFDMKVLESRLKFHLAKNQASDQLNFSDKALIPNESSLANVKIEFTVLELKLLVCLIQRSNRVMSLEDLRTTVWNSKPIPDAKITETMNIFKKKIMPLGNLVDHVEGFGYFLRSGAISNWPIS